MNKTEKQVKNILTQIGFEVKNYKEKKDFDYLNTFYSQVNFKKFRLDFALITAKLAIEINGEFWHGSRTLNINHKQLKRKISDKEKYLCLKNHNWNVIEFTDLDLKRSNIKTYLRSRIMDSIIV